MPESSPGKSSGAEKPASPRVIPGPPVAPHGHQIQAGHRTVLPEEDAVAVERLAGILAAGAEALGPARTGQLSRLCGEFPAFLDGWARLAQAAYATGDHVAAYAYSRVGYHRGLDRLRRHGWGGTGEVRWADVTNQGFLRSLFMLMAAAAALGETDELGRCRTFLLDLDPEDGLRVAQRPALVVGQVMPVSELP